MGATRFGDDDGETELSTVIVRCSVLPALVEHLPCTLCGTCSLTIRVVDCGLGMVSMLETYCTACEEVLGMTHSCDCVGGSKATNRQFVVTRSVVTSTIGWSRWPRQVLPVLGHSRHEQDDAPDALQADNRSQQGDGE